VLLIDAIVVKIRDGQVANRPIYVAMGINLEGELEHRGVLEGMGSSNSCSPAASRTSPRPTHCAASPATPPTCATS
jgi:hypothetical protein